MSLKGSSKCLTFVGVKQSKLRHLADINAKIFTHEMAMKRLIIGLLLIAYVAPSLLEVGQMNGNIVNHPQDVEHDIDHIIATSDTNDLRSDLNGATVEANGNHTVFENEYTSLLESIHESNTIDEVLHHAEEVPSSLLNLFIHS